MRLALALAALGPFLPTPAAAQVPTDPAELQRRFEDKLAAPFLQNAHWYTDLTAARRAAAREGKLILAHCTRSFVPCGTSIRCEQEVLSTPEFAAWAADVVLYCHVTAHVDQEYDRWFARWGAGGWPHHAVLDASGRLMGRLTSDREKSVAAFQQLIQDAKAFQAIEAEVERTIAAAAAKRLQAGLRIGALSLSEARALLAQAGPLPQADAQRIAGQLADLEVMPMRAIP